MQHIDIAREIRTHQQPPAMIWARLLLAVFAAAAAGVAAAAASVAGAVGAAAAVAVAGGVSAG